MNHAAFISAYREGRITVEFDPARAGAFLSARLLLPVFMLPLLGAGVARLVMERSGADRSGHHRAAPHFLLTQMLADTTLYDDVQRAGIVRVVDATLTT